MQLDAQRGEKIGADKRISHGAVKPADASVLGTKLRRTHFRIVAWSAEMRNEEIKAAFDTIDVWRAAYAEGSQCGSEKCLPSTCGRFPPASCGLRGVAVRLAI